MTFIYVNIMIFIAVHAWKNLPSPNNIIGLIFATAIFVICGFEHCIANFFYCGCAFNPTIGVSRFLILNTLGNAIGGVGAYRLMNYIKS